MSLKAELETWAAALKAYDDQDFDRSLELFASISDASKILTNMGLIYATLGEHEAAVEKFNEATSLDQYLAVAYFQCGVSNFLLGRYDLAAKDFEEAFLYLRGNQAINYEQLGLKFRLYSAEVLFNKGLCHVYLGATREGLEDMREAQREKATDEHNVIDDAINEQGEGYTVFSIPVGVLYRPPENKLKNAKTKDYLGKAKLVAAENPNEAYTTFTGVTRLQQGYAPTGAPLDRPLSDPRDDRPANATVTRAATAAARIERSNTTLNVRPLNPGGGLAKSATVSGGPSPRPPPKSDAGGAAGAPSAFPARARNASPAGGRFSPPQAAPLRVSPSLRAPGRSPAASPISPAGRGPPPAQGGPVTPASAGPGGARMTEIYDDYLDAYGGTDEPPPPVPADTRVAAWTQRTNPGAPPNVPPSRAASTRAPPSAYGGAAPSVVSRGSVRRVRRNPTVSSRSRSSRYEEEEEGYVSGEYEEVQYELTKIKIKLHYQNDIRGMATTPEMSFDEFMDKVTAKFGKSFGDLGLKFKDEDGGQVSLRDESDYELAIETARESAKGKPEGKLEIWCVDE